MSTATATSSVSAPSNEALADVLRRMKEAQRKSGAPTYEERIASLEKLEHALLSRKNAIADAVSRDFGNRSRHESMVSEIFIVLGAIKHA
ncbi:MAG TPA: hypothetical protein VMI75_11145, partial [Polyangiaceae bacterium]|nr:hypothetical protein [Polyangiaceae bacterium]